MTEGKFEAFLKLFCITESRHVSIEPSWQSWMVLCLCIVSAIATASSGVYFHRSNAVKSSVICFTASVAGFGMTLVTFIAILLGRKRRRRFAASVRNDESGTIYTNHGLSEQSTCIQIEQDVLMASHPETANRMWMNPVYAEYNESLYEADWNKEKGPGKTFEKDETDFDERDSDYFHSSLDTMTCSYRSYSDDEGYFQYSSKESNLKKTFKNSLERHEDHRWIPERKLLEGRVEQNIIAPDPTTFDTGGKSSIAQQNSRLDQFQTSMEHKMNYTRSSNTRICPIISKNTIYFETENIPTANLTLMKNTVDFHSNPDSPGNVFHSNCIKHEFHVEDEKGANMDSTEFQNNPLISMAHEKDIKSIVNNVNNSSACEKHGNDVFLIKSLESQNDSVTSILFEKQNLPTVIYTRIESSDNVVHHKESFSSERPNESQNGLKNTLIHIGDNISTINNAEDRSQSTARHSKCSLLPKPVEYQNGLPAMTQKTYSTNKGSSYSVAPDQNILANKEIQQSKHKLELPSEFPSLPYPILPSNHQSKNQRRRSKKSEGALMPRYEKRPLLDANGLSISQKALVKTLTRLLNSGLQELPKYSVEPEVKQNFQLDIESLQHITC